MCYGALSSQGTGSSKPGVHVPSFTPETTEKHSSSILSFMKKTKKYALYRLQHT